MSNNIGTKNEKHDTFIIAEAGVNHNGRLDIAKKLIDVAADSGADAVKFQTFNVDKLVCRYAPKAEYQSKADNATTTQYEMLKGLEFSKKEHIHLVKHCRKRKILFMSTPFDEESLQLLINLKLQIIKISSSDITNLPLLRSIGMLKKRVILSTGMSTLMEIQEAVNILLKTGMSEREITILHCNSEYPTPFHDVNLMVLKTLQAEFPNNRIGYSDHTLGIEAPIAAVALGAKVIEKHVTLDRSMRGPDHKASIECKELKEMVVAIRNIEKALGSGIKRPTASELKNKSVVRRSIVAARHINKGEIFTDQSLAVKRPGTGISPMRWDEVIEKRAERAYRADEAISNPSDKELRK